ncbi:hypothetical protein KCP77_04130 [Salmonella enterica subsp. enterica]|nr:hypothetical protein KCP77_04130 [Salmonella enterica subsp. enterica]
MKRWMRCWRRASANGSVGVFLSATASFSYYRDKTRRCAGVTILLLSAKLF